MPLSVGAGTAIAAGLTAAATLGGVAANQGLTKQARRENYEYNEMAAKNAFERQKAMQDYMQQLQYKQFYDLESPKAIIEQLKQAGLSPSLYADSALGSNVSGISTAGAAPQGNGAQGLPAPQVPYGMGDIAQMILATSQAKKNEAEADRISGQGEMGQADKEKIIAEILGTKARAAYTELQTKLANVRLYVSEGTKDYDIKKAAAEAESAEHNAHYIMYLARTQGALAQVEEGTITEKVKSEYLKNKNLQTQRELMQAQIGLSDAEAAKVSSEVEKWREELLQGWVKLQLEGGKNETYRKSVEYDYDFKKRNIEYLYDKLQQDKEIADKINELRHKELVETWVNDILSNVADVIAPILKEALAMAVSK